MKNRTIICTTLLLACFELSSPKAFSVVPPPDGGYPGGNTAEGQNSLLSLTTGTYNTAVGLFSLLNNTEGSFNTAMGAGTLLVNTGDENTATGAGALLSNTVGTGNLADGAFALFNNTEGSTNTAIGDRALFTNTTGINNTATDITRSSSTTETLPSQRDPIIARLEPMRSLTIPLAITIAPLVLAHSQSNTIGEDNTAVGY